MCCCTEIAGGLKRFPMGAPVGIVRSRRADTRGSAKPEPTDCWSVGPRETRVSEIGSHRRFGKLPLDAFSHPLPDLTHRCIPCPISEESQNGISYLAGPASQRDCRVHAVESWTSQRFYQISVLVSFGLQHTALGMESRTKEPAVCITPPYGITTGSDRGG